MNCRSPAPRWPAPPTRSPERPRNMDREREIMDLAARGAERLDDAGLSHYADTRALPGGVRTDQDWRRHAIEELGDCRHYLVWDTEDHWDAYLAGDLQAGERVAENLAALSGLIVVWAGLRQRS